MSTYPHQIDQQATTSIQLNKLLRNTYMLLGMILSFGAVVAYISTALQLPSMPWFVMMIGFYGLFFMIAKFRNSVVGLGLTFALAGLLGYSAGTVLSIVLQTSTGTSSVVMALGLTAMVFFGLSGYAITSKKDFSFLSGFLFAGFIVILGAMLLSFFVNIPILHLVISAAMVLFSSAMILFETSRLINDPNANYVMVTVGLFVSLYNLFMSLLHIIMSFRD